MQTGKIYSPPSVFLAELTRGNIIVPTRNLLTGKVASLLTVANGPNIFPGVILLNFYTSFQRRGKKNIGKIDSCECICICIYRTRVSKFYIQKWELSVLLHRLNLIRIYIYITIVSVVSRARLFSRNALHAFIKLRRSGVIR